MTNRTRGFGLICALLVGASLVSVQSIDFANASIILEPFGLLAQGQDPWSDIGGPGNKNLEIVGGVQHGRILGANAERSNVVIVVGDDGSGKERWMMTPIRDGTWQIAVINETSAKFLTASNDEITVFLADGNGSMHQRWRLEANTGFWRIMAWNDPNSGPGPYLSATENGGLILTYVDDMTGRQRWNILPEGSVPVEEAATSPQGRPEPMDTKSFECGTFNVTRASVSCPAWHQHAECWPNAAFGSCTPKCECKEGAAQKPPAPHEFPPPGHWDVLTFTSENAGISNGIVSLSVPGHGSTQTQDVGAPPSKMVHDVAFLCLQIHVSCPAGGNDTIAIPFGATLKSDATVTARDVLK